MKCPVCEKEGKKSQVYSKGSSTTAMYWQPFYDEEGVYHHHDRNTTTAEYQCSNAHRWRILSRPSCPAVPSCDFVGSSEIKIIKEKV